MIDEDAYHLLSKYLDALYKHFHELEGAADIIHDIEVRMAELFHQKLKGRQIVSVKDLHEVMDIMGKPEQMEDNTAIYGSNIENKNKFAHRTEYTIRTGKKLFRDEDNKILAGVCAGLARYFGIYDPIWIRFIFVIFTLSGGAGILAYIIFWIMVPAAKSSSDKLAMQGEPINVSSIAKKVQEELQEFSKTICNFGKEIKIKS